MRLEIINGQKNYGKRPILNQLNLVFQSGKFMDLKVIMDLARRFF